MKVLLLAAAVLLLLPLAEGEFEDIEVPDLDNPDSESMGETAGDDGDEPMEPVGEAAGPMPETETEPPVETIVTTTTTKAPEYTYATTTSTLSPVHTYPTTTTTPSPGYTYSTTTESSEYPNSSMEPTYLQANKSEDTYTLIQSVFGNYSIESPDCVHTSYGPHITQRLDQHLNRDVFVFHLHINEDTKDCDRQLENTQRIEIRPDDPNKMNTSALVAEEEGEMVSLSWNFRLNAAFQVSTKFTNIHQLEVSGTNNPNPPLITFTLIKYNGANMLQIRHTDRHGVRTTLKSAPLSRFAGVWVHAVEDVTYSQTGSYSLKLTRFDNGLHLLHVNATEIDMGRDLGPNGFIRPKWGIVRNYGGVEVSLRDEHVKYDSFCLAKGYEKCT